MLEHSIREKLNLGSQAIVTHIQFQNKPSLLFFWYESQFFIL